MKLKPRKETYLTKYLTSLDDQTSAFSTNICSTRGKEEDGE